MIAVVSIGQMQWDVAIADLIPQMIRTGDVPESAKPAKAPAGKGLPRLEDFGDE